MISKREVFEFVKKHENCVLAAASRDGKPEAATMGFGVDDLAANPQAPVDFKP